ncbi:MAG TPA: opacity family porin [Bdellovibrionales bacterium]|nr:opacity family porin [Bdellovibrionales bacterium]
MTSRSALFAFLIVLAAVAKPSAAQNLLGGGLAFSNAEITGSGYRAEKQSSMLVAGQVSRFLRGGWRGSLSLAGTTDAETLYASIGASYHFRPLVPNVDAPSEYVDYRIVSDWSPYVGMDFGFNRVQLSLARADGTQTDAVIGALVGPGVRAGTYYSLNAEWALQAEVAMSYAFSSAVASSAQTLTIFAVYLLP